MNRFRDKDRHGGPTSPKEWVYQPLESLGTFATLWLDELIFFKYSCIPPVFCQTEFIWWLFLAQLLPKLLILITFEWTNFCWHADSWKQDKKYKKHFSKQTSHWKSANSSVNTCSSFKYCITCIFVIFCLLSIADTADSQKILKDVTQALSEHYSFHSITIQIESGEDQKEDCIFCQEPRDWSEQTAMQSNDHPSHKPMLQSYTYMCWLNAID